jgi:pyoverdine/dityrosine biosynthesis protein Dit1
MKVCLICWCRIEKVYCPELIKIYWMSDEHLFSLSFSFKVAATRTQSCSMQNSLNLVTKRIDVSADKNRALFVRHLLDVG